MAASASGILRAGGLLALAGVAAAVFLILRGKSGSVVKAAAEPALQPLAQDLLDSAGAAVTAVGLNGRMIISIQLLSSCWAAMPRRSRVSGRPRTFWRRGEAARLISEMQKLCGIDKPIESTPAGRIAACLDCVRALPLGVAPTFDSQLRRRDGQLIPVTLRLSALRDQQGEFRGLMAVALDAAAGGHDPLEHEAQQPYRDLFDGSVEMIARLTPAGRFLYANPAWKRCFGLENEALLRLESFEHLFGGESRGQAAAFFRRVLDGELSNAPDCAITLPTAVCWSWS